MEIGPTSGTCDDSKEEECIGGIARVKTASKKLREERPNAIFLNAGDYYQGTIWYTLFKWNVTAEFTNKLHYDVSVNLILIFTNLEQTTKFYTIDKFLRF